MKAIEYTKHVTKLGVINANYYAGNIDDTKHDIKVIIENTRHCFTDKAIDYPLFSEILNPIADAVQTAGDIACDLYDLFN